MKCNFIMGDKTLPLQNILYMEDHLDMHMEAYAFVLDQIEDVTKKFGNLEKLEANSWQQTTVQAKKVVRVSLQFVTVEICNSVNILNTVSLY